MVKDRACSTVLQPVGSGRASEELWAVLEQGMEPMGRESKVREGRGKKTPGGILFFNGARSLPGFPSW